MDFLSMQQARNEMARKAAAYDQARQEAALQQVHAQGAQQGYAQGMQDAMPRYAPPVNAAEAAAIKLAQEQAYLDSIQGNPQVTTPVQTQQGGNARLAEDPRDTMSPQTLAWLQQIRANK